ncbi:hypothetical protein ES705_46436 [subsurface metagenome]
MYIYSYWVVGGPTEIGERATILWLTYCWWLLLLFLLLLFLLLLFLLLFLLLLFFLLFLLPDWSRTSGQQ